MYSICSRCIILNCFHIIFSTHTISRVLLLPYCIVLCIAKKSCVMVYTSGGTMLQNLTLGKQVTRALNPVYLPQGLERLVGGGRECSLPGRIPWHIRTTASGLLWTTAILVWLCGREVMTGANIYSSDLGTQIYNIKFHRCSGCS